MTFSKLCVVTGANKGIGFDIAKKVLSNEGVLCIVAARDQERGESAVQELSKDCKGKAVFKQLDVTDAESRQRFISEMEQEYGKCHVLVNNAGFAFKGSDPTPASQQGRPTFDTNFFGLVAFTEGMLPLMKKASTKEEPARIVNMGSFTGHLKILKSDELRQKLTSDSLSKGELLDLAKSFVDASEAGTLDEGGWPSTTYGTSKLFVIAYTRVLAREEPDLLVNCCCPGYVNTDMTSHKGQKTPEEGARTPYLLAMELPADKIPTGTFWQNEKQIEW